MTDKSSLIEHCRALYREAVDKDVSIVQTAKSIVEAIVDYSRENSLDITVYIIIISLRSETIKLSKTNIYLADS